MSDNNNNVQNTQFVPDKENFQPLPPPEKFGCAAWLGVLLLLGVIGAVLYFLVLKPQLEKEGITVDEKIEEIKQQASETCGSLKEGAAKAVDAGVRGAKAVQEGAAKLWNQTAQTAEKAADTAGEAGEAAKDIAEKTAETKDKVQKKTEEKVDSWY